MPEYKVDLDLVIVNDLIKDNKHYTTEIADKVVIMDSNFTNLSSSVKTRCDVLAIRCADSLSFLQARCDFLSNRLQELDSPKQELRRSTRKRKVQFEDSSDVK